MRHSKKQGIFAPALANTKGKKMFLDNASLAVLGSTLAAMVLCIAALMRTRIEL